MTSLRRRILLPLVPIVAAALVVAAWAIERSVRSRLTHSLDQRLTALGHLVAAAIDVEEDGHVEFMLEQQAMPETGGAAPMCLYAVRDAGGRLVASAPASASRIRAAPGLDDAAVAGRPFRTISFSVARAREDAAGRAPPDEFQVVVGLSSEETYATLSTLRTRLAAAFGLLLVVLVGLPTALVVRAMRSLHRLSHEAAGVGPEHPDARLDAAGADQEVRSLVVAMNDALDRLAAALAREKSLTSDTAHELRTPLGTIRAHCEVALRRARSAAELREAIVAIHGTTVRLAKVAEKLLALARLERGARGPLRRPADLAQAAREAAGLHAPAARAKGVHLDLDLPDRIDVLGDETLLAESISNLVENAVRHTPPGGRIRIEGSERDRGGVAGAVVAIEDTGEGIAPEHLPALFDRFYRVDASRSPAGGSAGLGLAIARQIARLHGGDITVSSTPGRGTRFEIHLPGPAEP